MKGGRSQRIVTMTVMVTTMVLLMMMMLMIIAHGVAVCHEVGRANTPTK